MSNIKALTCFIEQTPGDAECVCACVCASYQPTSQSFQQDILTRPQSESQEYKQAKTRWQATLIHVKKDVSMTIGREREKQF